MINDQSPKNKTRSLRRPKKRPFRENTCSTIIISRPIYSESMSSSATEHQRQRDKSCLCYSKVEKKFRLSPARTMTDCHRCISTLFGKKMRPWWRSVASQLTQPPSPIKVKLFGCSPSWSAWLNHVGSEWMECWHFFHCVQTRPLIQ